MTLPPIPHGHWTSRVKVQYNKQIHSGDDTLGGWSRRWYKYYKDLSDRLVLLVSTFHKDKSHRTKPFPHHLLEIRVGVYTQTDDCRRGRVSWQSEINDESVCRNRWKSRWNLEVEGPFDSFHFFSFTSSPRRTTKDLPFTRVRYLRFDSYIRKSWSWSSGTRLKLKVF